MLKTFHPSVGQLSLTEEQISDDGRSDDSESAGQVDEHLEGQKQIVKHSTIQLIASPRLKQFPSAETLFQSNKYACHKKSKN